MQFVTLVPSQSTYQEVYQLMSATIVPRPIAFVSTCSREGIGNLAPFSYFNAVASEPATLMFVVSTKVGGEKDTLKNIRETEEFVVNSSNDWMLDQMVKTASDFPYGVDELKQVGLTPLASEVVRPVRVAESAAQFECKLSGLHQIGAGGPGSSTVVFGEILRIHTSTEVLTNGRVDSTKFKPLARLGGSEYAVLGEILKRTVPKV